MKYLLRSFIMLFVPLFLFSCGSEDDGLPFSNSDNYYYSAVFHTRDVNIVQTFYDINVEFSEDQILIESEDQRLKIILYDYGYAINNEGRADVEEYYYINMTLNSVQDTYYAGSASINIQTDVRNISYSYENGGGGIFLLWKTGTGSIRADFIEQDDSTSILGEYVLHFNKTS
ncbi:MAG: hypothetical protein RIC80_07775 [Cyclobacteriaceae bacterium]